MKTSIWLLAAMAAACSAMASAQPVPVAPAPSIDTQTAAQATSECCLIADGTPLELEIAEPISSANRKRGDRFAIRLHADLRSGDTIVIPAGTTGVGEVVHGERSRGGGKPGELLLAARYLELDGNRVLLRGLKFGDRGEDKTNVALGTSFVIGPFAHFIRGKEIEIPAGTLVTAKLGQDVPVPPASSTATAVDPAADQTSTNTQE